MREAGAQTHQFVQQNPLRATATRRPQAALSGYQQGQGVARLGAKDRSAIRTGTHTAVLRAAIGKEEGSGGGREREFAAAIQGQGRIRQRCADNA